MVKSVIMGKYMRQQKYMRAVMKNRKSINSGLIQVETDMGDHNISIK